MAKYNPFFEKAGMQKIAESKPNKTRHRNTRKTRRSLALTTMLLGSTSLQPQNNQQTGTQAIITILTELSEHDGGIRRRLANTTNPYPKHEEFTQKIARLQLNRACRSTKTPQLRKPNQNVSFLEHHELKSLNFYQLNPLYYRFFT